MVPPAEGDSEKIARGPTAEEMERYRKKLAEWRGMGFDVSSLEVLLETDFPQFKQRRFELLRSQILDGRPAQAARWPSPEGARPAAAPSQPARPSLFSHFAPFHGRGAAPETAIHPRPATPAASVASHSPVQLSPSQPSAATPLPDQSHSEMRYPSVRRKREKRVRTFSVSAEPQGARVGMIDLGGATGRKATAPVRNVPAPPPPDIEITVEEEPGQENEQAQAPEDGPGLEEGPEEEGEPEGEQEGPEMEAESEEEPGVEESETVEDSSGEGPGPRKVVKRRMVKTASRPKNSAWLAAGAVVMLVLAGLGAWYFLGGPSESLTARDWHPASARAGENVTFDARNSSSSGSRIINYSWDLGDGGRAYLKRTTHHYVEPGTYHVTLTVRNEKGATASRRSVITITPLVVTVPLAMVGDKGNYNAYGSASVSNTDTYLYTIDLPPPFGATHVTKLDINFSGTLDQWARQTLSKEDGFKTLHNALQTDSRENLLFSGSATTTSATIPINGGIDYNESSYTDPASGGVFEMDSHATTTISASLMPKPMVSSDTLRSYPSVAGVTDQFRLEKIYSGHRFDQSDNSTLNGNLTGGGIAYSWTSKGVDNAGGLPSVGIHVTADAAALRSSGISEFFVDLYVSGGPSMPTSTHVHVAGMSGGNSFVSDHYTEMIGHSAGSTPVDRTPPVFNADPLPAGMFSQPFSDVPAAGAGSTSLKFTPEEAVSEARSKNAEFSSYLAANPAAYAIRGKYYEGPVPDTACWNLSFGYPGAGTGRYINVTRDILHQYSVSSGWETPSKVTTPEGNLTRILTLSSAQAIFQNDSATASNFFSGENIQYSSGATLSLEADGSYPAINLASMSASAQTSRYVAILGKSEKTATQTIDYTSALSMDNGQMLYYLTHAVG